MLEIITIIHIATLFGSLYCLYILIKHKQLPQRIFNLFASITMASGCSLILINKAVPAFEWCSPVGVSLQVISVGIIVTMKLIGSKRR